MNAMDVKTRNPRIALYYAPPASSAWWREGCEWLGRDPESGRENATPAHELTHAPRRYGWHATLVAPFHLAQGLDLADVLACARAWASAVPRFDMPVQAAELGNFVALRPVHTYDDDWMRALASQALQTLNVLRAPPPIDSIDRRIVPGMSARQISLLREWGYPYVLDEYRFHMTLSDSLDDANARASIISEWTARIDTLGPMPVHGAAIFIEPEPGAPFTLWQRLPFTSAQDAAT